MKTKNLYSALLLACAVQCVAQNENGVWLFNNETGIDFMTPPPSILHDFFGYGGNTAAISDENGQLVFFSDDNFIWNSQNQVLVNGDGLLDSFSNAPQSSMILPWPGRPGLYYMIQPHLWTSSLPDPRAFYHRINMNGDGGSGEVAELNALLADSAGAYMTAVLDSVGTGIWVILHHLNAPEFMAYHLDVDGLDTIPVLSAAGIPIGQSPYQGMGILRPSPNGDRLYLLKPYSTWTTFSSLHAMDFNRSTGQVSNFMTFGGPAYGGLEISPSGQFLYTTTNEGDSGIVSRLWQYDVSSEDSATIHDSKTLVYEASSPGSGLGRIGNLALAVDGRIYCAVSNAYHLGVINQPDLPAPACDYVHDGLYLDGDSSWLWLPNQMREYPSVHSGITNVQSAVERLRVRPNPASDGCRITLPGNSVRSLGLMDATGRLILDVQCEPGQREVLIDRAGLASGIYQAIARNGEGGAVAAGRVVFE